MKIFREFVFCIISVAIFSACSEDCEDNYTQECADSQLTTDIQIIQDYLEANNLQAQRHPSDLFYIIDEEGSGDIPNQGQTVLANYTGKFLDGRVFDTSIESEAIDGGVYNPDRNYAPFSFVLGQNRVIRGWEIAFSLFKEGTKATIIVPSYLAYSFRGQGSIPPNTVLLFEVELVDIRF